MRKKFSNPCPPAKQFPSVLAMANSSLICKIYKLLKRLAGTSQASISCLACFYFLENCISEQIGIVTLQVKC